jgi:hypothetical protein
VSARTFVTIPGMTHRGVISELRAIAEQSAKAADRCATEADLVNGYEGLRERAVLLARTQGLATEDQLANQFPSPRALLEIERLDIAFGATPAPGLASDRGLPARLGEALLELSGWATGARLAYETLEEDQS